MPDLQRSKERLRRRAILAALGACFAILALAATAQAETLTLGPALTGPGSSGYCSIEACDEMLLTTEAPSVEIASPIDGTVVRWRVKGPSATPGYSLNVLRDNGDGTYTVTASTGPVTPAGNEIETLATSLPIHVGEYIELNLPQNGQFTALEGESTYATFFPSCNPAKPAHRLTNTNIPTPSATTRTSNLNRPRRPPGPRHRQRPRPRLQSQSQWRKPTASSPSWRARS